MHTLRYLRWRLARLVRLPRALRRRLDAVRALPSTWD